MTDKMSYGNAVEELEKIVALLEKGGVNLDETLRLYERGAELLKFCQAELTSAEGKLNEMRIEDLD